MTPRPIIVFDTVPKVRISGQFKFGVVSVFNEGLGGLSGVNVSITDGTTTQTQSKTGCVLRTEFYDVGSMQGTGIYSTYSGYINPNFYYSGFPTPAWDYEFSFNTTGFLGSSPYLSVTATAVPNNSAYSGRSIGCYFIKDALVSKPEAWVDNVNGVDATGRGGSSLPYRTIAGAMAYNSNNGSTSVSNLQVYLSTGIHDYIGDPLPPYGPNLFQSISGWVDIQPASGLSRASVIISGSTAGWTPSNNSVQHLHFKNLTVKQGMFGGVVNNQQVYIWQDNCDVKGGETFDLSVSNCMMSNANFLYVTNTKYSNTIDGMGWTNLTRDCLISGYLQAAFRVIPEGYPINGNRSGLLVLNSQSMHQNALGGGSHPDFLHFDFIDPSGIIAQNVVAQGVRGTDLANSQAIFAGADSPHHQDIAFIDVLIHSGNSRIYGGVDHMVMRHCAFPSGTWLWAPGYLYGSNVTHWNYTEITNTIFNSMSMESGSDLSQINAINNTWSGNYISNNAWHNIGYWTGMGTEYRSGNIQYYSAVSGDYRAVQITGNPIFSTGHKYTGWNGIGTETITHLQPTPLTWAYNGYNAPISPDLGPWYLTATDPTALIASFSGYYIDTGSEPSGQSSGEQPSGEEPMAITYTSCDPSDGQTDWFINKSITITFSDTLSVSSLNSSTINVIDTASGTAVELTISRSSTAPNKVIVIPNTMLKENTNYRIVIVGADLGLGVQINGADGTSLATTVYVNFVTGSSIYKIDTQVGKDSADLTLEGDLFLPTNLKALGYDFTVEYVRPANHHSSVPTNITGDNRVVFTFSQPLLTGQDYTTWADINVYQTLNNNEYLVSGSSMGATIPDYSVGVTGYQLYVQFSGELPKNTSVSVHLTNQITASDGTEYGGDMEYSFITTLYPAVAGVELIKREIRPIASFFNDDYISALLHKNTIWLWEKLGRRLDLSNVGFAATQYIIADTIIQLIEDVDLSKWVKDGVQRRLGDMFVSVTTMLGKYAIKQARYEKVKQNAWESLNKGWGIKVGISSVAYEEAAAEVSRLWYNTSNKYIFPMYKFHQNGEPSSNVTLNRWAKTNNPIQGWW